MKTNHFHKLNSKLWERIGYMNNKNEDPSKKDLLYEGKEEKYLDIDRIINEGLSGGSVHARNDTTNIEEAYDFVNEDPPYKSE
jgi:hypothetical protein